MMTAGSVGSRSAATKRLMKEYAELQSSPNYQYSASPLEDNMFDWHFTIRGPEDSEFENGIYHGRIVLPPQYPYKPPSIYFLTPNGRFELGKKICLSITGYHPETWLPAWGIRTALIALISFMTTEGKDAIGALDYTPEERRILAKKSQSWHCPQCGCKNCEQVLPKPKKEEVKEEKENNDDAKLAEMLVVSHDKKQNNNEQENQVEKETVEQNTIKSDVNNENIPNSDNKPLNQSNETLTNITPSNSVSSINNNINNVEVNVSTVQQRVPSSVADTTTAESIKQTQDTASTSSNTANNSSASSQASLSRTNSQTNINNNNDDRYKSFIDTLIIIVFSLLTFLLYYRATKEKKFWNDME